MPPRPIRQLVILGDGARWIWKLADARLPAATQIVDLFHAREHLHALAEHLAFITPDPAAWLTDRLADLDAGNIETIVQAARIYPLVGTKAEACDKALAYFEPNAHRMRYAHYRKLGMFVGIGARLKQSGMRWTSRGATAITTLRCQHANSYPGQAHPLGHTGAA